MKSLINVTVKDREGLTPRLGYASRAAEAAGGDPRTAGEIEAGTWTSGEKNEGSAELCGDTAFSCRLPGGSRAVILSDGMGHGRSAAAESRRASALLRRQLKQGVPVAKAIREVNRQLFQKAAGRECFATVDLMILDRAAERARFYKLGAAPSYIVRGRRIRTVQQPALPVGILPQLKLTHVSARLAAGDIIVMMSDGISDSGWRCQDGTGYGRHCREQADWVPSFLNDLAGGSMGMEKNGQRPGPRKLAAMILEEAKRRYGAGESDDATVVVIEIE